jgi:hypothetical protein
MEAPRSPGSRGSASGGRQARPAGHCAGIGQSRDQSKVKLHLPPLHSYMQRAWTAPVRTGLPTRWLCSFHLQGNKAPSGEWGCSACTPAPPSPTIPPLPGWPSAPTLFRHCPSTEVPSSKRPPPMCTSAGGPALQIPSASSIPSSTHTTISPNLH